MANPKHLRILKQGVEVWNQWRKDKPKIEPQLSGVRLVGPNLLGPDANDPNLKIADISPAELSGVNFSKVNLSDAYLRGADLSQADLSQTNLSHANLFDTNLSNANLENTNLKGANLLFTLLSGALIKNVNFADTSFESAMIGWNIFSDVDLGVVKGLNLAEHEAPSTIGIDTIYKSKGNIPEVFLRRAGVPETFITFSKSLVAKAIDYYSCFISFTEADDILSERLYNDLQAAGVRCWRWKEDAKLGRTLMRSIDEAVRVYDKLIVICSEASMKSPAVIREIERALQKEDDLTRRGEDGEVLFPIRLDNYIFTDWNHYRKADVTAKNVGDFRQWKEPELYRKALDRLIRDLKVGETAQERS